MREIKFRGKDDNGHWHFGDLSTSKHFPPQIVEGELYPRFFFVCPDTVGQFTGIKDITGADIYESDIVSFKDDETDEHVRGLVTQSVEGTWWVVCNEFRVPLLNVRKTTLIMNNVYDNPELLEADDARD